MIPGVKERENVGGSRCGSKQAKWTSHVVMEMFSILIVPMSVCCDTELWFCKRTTSGKTGSGVQGISSTSL